MLHQALLTGDERGDLLSTEGFEFSGGSLQRAVFDLHLASTHVLLDDRKQDVEREPLTVRTSQVTDLHKCASAPPVPRRLVEHRLDLMKHRRGFWLPRPLIAPRLS